LLLLSSRGITGPTKHWSCILRCSHLHHIALLVAARVM
jgi:hypothetical protein